MTDKIFNNTFEDSDFEADSMFNFNIDPGISDDKDEEEKIYFEQLSLDIHELIKNHSKYYIFNEVDKDGNIKKIKKNDINELFQFLINQLKEKYGMMDIFSESCKYFDIEPKKFYKSLNNSYKEDLVQVLDEKTNALEKRNIQKLF